MTLHTMTGDQEAYLNSLIVQRLHDSSKNRTLISSFFNKTNPNLARDLHEGWKDDQNGETAYYVVKDPNNSLILLYFSLRCGSLHAPDPYNRIQADYKRAEALYAAAKGLKNARKWALEMIEAYKAQGYDANGLIDYFKKVRDNKKAWLKALKKDAKDDPSQMTVQTLENYSGVELVQFCKNDRAEELWKNSFVGNVPMGECLFWRFILPVIQRTTKLVGCKYVYLFAADSSEEQSLVGYYKTKLHFEIPQDLRSHKPTYDVGCMPMCRELKVLERYQDDFMRNFNKPRPPKQKKEQ